MAEIRKETGQSIYNLESKVNNEFRRSTECELIIQGERKDNNNLVLLKLGEMRKELGK